MKSIILCLVLVAGFGFCLNYGISKAEQAECERFDAYYQISDVWTAPNWLLDQCEHYGYTYPMDEWYGGELVQTH